MAGKKSSELFAEVLRDIGILFFVFAPLDTLVKSGHLTQIDWVIAGGIAVAGLVLIDIGIRMGSGK
ncbi:MAG: hypothetical protein WBF04_12515 [Candidatus Sulfotelmatobacter sp.]